MHILKLNRTGKFALNVVDNLVVVHHQDTEVGLVPQAVLLSVPALVFETGFPCVAPTVLELTL